MRAFTDIWAVCGFTGTSLIGNEDVRALVATNPRPPSILAACRPAAVAVYTVAAAKSMNRCRQPHQGYSGGRVRQRVAYPRGPRSGPARHAGVSFLRSPIDPLRDAAFRRLGPAPRFPSRTLSCGTARLAVTLQRVSHGQQNANRCVPPRRNEGGRRPR
jgi:hypothetical protein